MKYPFTVERTESGGYILQLVDIQEVIAHGDSLDEARSEILSAFLSFAEWLFDDGLPIPLPSSAGCDSIDVPVSVTAKILLLNAMTETKTRPSDIARKTGLAKQEMTRITNLRYKTKIDTLERAINATGKTLRLQAV